MKTRYLLFVLFLWTLTCMAQIVNAESILLIQIEGSDTLLHVAQTWVEVYEKKETNVAVSVSGGGSGMGFHAMLIGTADLVNAECCFNYSLDDCLYRYFVNQSAPYP